MAILDNFVAYWRGEEASGSRADATGRGNTATVPGVDPASVTGKIGNAIQFVNGAGKSLQVADNADLSAGDNDLTWGCWCNLDTLVNGVMMSKYNISGNQREYLFYYNQNDHAPNNRFSLTVSSNGTAITTIDATAFGAISATTWYFVVGWHDSVNNLLGISVNDVASTAAYSSGIFDGTSAFRLGSLLNGATGVYEFNGKVDEPFVVRRVLTAAEITYLYNSGAGRSYADLVDASTAKSLFLPPPRIPLALLAR